MQRSKSWFSFESELAMRKVTNWHFYCGHTTGLTEVLFKTLQGWNENVTIFRQPEGIVVGFVGTIVTELCSVFTEVRELCSTLSTWSWSWKSNCLFCQECAWLFPGLKLNSDTPWPPEGELISMLRSPFSHFCLIFTSEVHKI